MTALPDDTPATTPDALTVATDIMLLLHVPPDTVGVRVTSVPLQSVSDPEIVPANGVVRMDITATSTDEPQAAATV